MLEGPVAVVKPEMKPFIWLRTSDGSIQQVEEEVAMFCPVICEEVLQSGMGSSKNYAISLPQRVNPAILGLILDYCRFHRNLKVVEEPLVDERSVDDLLSFINGGDGDSKGAKSSKCKKKNRVKKDQSRNSWSNVDNIHNKEPNYFSMSCCTGVLGYDASTGKNSISKDLVSVTLSPKLDLDDGDIDDGLDPAMKEELDREVEDFARRLNSVWPERMQELLSIGLERTPVPVMMSKIKRSTGLSTS